MSGLCKHGLARHDVAMTARRLSPLFAGALLLASGTGSVAAAQPRTMSWPRIEVTAHLDATGRLEVRERQVIRFEGEWNGGERVFDVRRGQRVEILGISRLDPATGVLRPLTWDGDLDDVDDASRVDGGRTLRWRARRPSDPAFAGTEITYEITVAYERILQRRDDGAWELDHNFAMVDRDWPIDDFRLTLTLDPAWVTREDFTGRFGPLPLPPDQGFRVTIPLRLAGGAVAPESRTGAPPAVRALLGAILAGALLLLFARLVARERALGRFAEGPRTEEITREFIGEHLLAMLPEVAGATWDDTTSAPEVAAVLARLVQEGKLSSRVTTTKVLFVEQQVLHLTLNVDRSSLAAHERALIASLFEDHATTTDTASVRERYKSTGFDPASTIKGGIDAIVARAAPKGSKPAWRPTGALLAAGLVIAVIGAVMEPDDAALTGLAMLVSVPVFLVTLIPAVIAQRAAASPRGALAALLLVWAGVIALFAMLVLGTAIDILGGITLAGLTLWMLGLARSSTNIAASRQSPERIVLRRRLYAIRERFRAELRTAQPSLEDAWYPYVIAFGLGAEADKWFRAFGGATAAVVHSSGGDASGRGTASGNGWTGFGGGGAFSGGGSSAAFAAAVGGMAAAVPSPSSSSSGGGGSSSGGSSGGGGGGGW